MEHCAQDTQWWTKMFVSFTMVENFAAADVILDSVSVYPF